MAKNARFWTKKGYFCKVIHSHELQKNHPRRLDFDSSGATFFELSTDLLTLSNKTLSVFPQNEQKGRGNRKSFVFLSKPPAQSRETFLEFS